MDYDFLSSLLEEVALEGLDGITVSTLWIRLQNRPSFSIAIDEDSKKFLWGCIAMHKDVEIYELPTPRELVPIYNRYDHIDSEFGIVLEQSEPIIDPYPVVVVNDGNVRGSCSSYKSRLCITSKIRKGKVLLKSLEEVNGEWGEKLVLVASSKARYLSLTGMEIYPFDMTQEEYCLLERIGRSRYLGEVTQGEGGLLNLKAPFVKHIHYYHKKLASRGLVTKQPHYMKNKRDQAVTGSLYHLTKFYVPRKTKMEAFMTKIHNLLKDRPENRELTTVIRDVLHINANTLKKLLSRYCKFVKRATIPYKDFFPEASPKECLTANGKDRVVTVVQLLKHIDEVNDEYNDDIQSELESSQKLSVHFNCSKLYYDVPLIYQAYKIIEDAGAEGLSSAALGRSLTLPRLEIRTILRSLMKKNLVVTYVQEKGRQKENQYVAKNMLFQNENKQDLIQKKLVADELQNVKHLKRPHTDSDNLANKKAKLSQGTGEIILENGSNEEENFEQMDLQDTVSMVSGSGGHTSRAAKLISLAEKFVCHSSLSKDQLTDRSCKRKNIILDNLKSVGLCTFNDLFKYLSKVEEEEGYNYKLDRKSVKRIVYQLCCKKELKIFVAILELHEKHKEYELICDNSVEQCDSRVLFAIEQEKIKMFKCCTEKNKSKENVKQCGLDKEKNIISKKGDTDKCNVSENVPRSIFEEEVIFGSRNVPKYSRLKVLHEFLFYLVYDYKRCSSVSSSQKPLAYHNSMTWKRFVSPLASRREGWCFIANVYAYMPLSIFVQVINLRKEIKHVTEYLNDEEKSHYPIINLPLNEIFGQRKYIHFFIDSLKYLCYMGLVTFGPKESREIDNVHIYVHKKAAFKDTRMAPPHYIHIRPEIPYEKKIFHLNSLDDVQEYWNELEFVCLHTPLGRYSSIHEKTIAITEPSQKPELIKAIQNRAFGDISDDGTIPGDGLGAGGFDSTLYLHRRPNWKTFSGNSLKNTSNKKTSVLSELKLDRYCSPAYQDETLKEDAGKKKNVSSKPSVSSSLNDPIFDSALYLHRRQNWKTFRRSSVKNLSNKKKANGLSKIKLDRYCSPTYDDQILKDNAGKKNKVNCSKPSVSSAISRKRKRIKYKTFKIHNKNKRKQDSGVKDKVVNRGLLRKRYDWSPQEDSFLLLCMVTSLFLDSKSQSVVVGYEVVKDLLQENFPSISANKSTQACQRRVRYCILNPTTAKNIAVFLEEARLDQNLVSEFNGERPAKTNKVAWRELFCAALKRLLEKFTLPAAERCKMVSLPTSREVFNETFDVLTPSNAFHPKNNHKNPKCKGELNFSTLYSLIVLSMTLENNKNEWSQLLDKLYRDYPETMLKSVISCLQEEKVIALRKKNWRKDLQCCEMSTLPCHFSISYENTMLTKFPVKLFNESKELIDALKCVRGNGIELNDDTILGYVPAMFALTFMDELQLNIQIPEQVILFDNSSCADTQSVIAHIINALNEEESDELFKFLHNEKKNAPGSLQNLEGSTVEKPKNIKKKLLNKANEFRSTNASRFALYVMRQELSQELFHVLKPQHSQDCIVLNSCKVFCTLKENAHTLSDSMLENQSIAPLTKSLNKPTQKTLTDDTILEIKRSLVTFIPSEAFDEGQNFNACLEEIYNTYSSQTLEDAKVIFEVILKADIAGVSEKNLWKKFNFLNGELSLFKHLDIFREAMLIIRAGVASFVYVCICYAKSWALTSYLKRDIYYKSKLKNKAKNFDCSSSVLADEYKIDLHENYVASRTVNNSTKTSSNNDKSNITFQDTCTDNLKSKAFLPSSRWSAVDCDKKVHFLPRVWRYPDGTLNKSVFLNQLKTVLSYVISSPGVNTSQVIDRFSLALQPVQTLELLEILEKSCCIVKNYCKRHPKGKLFSSRVTIFTTENPDPDDLDHLESLPNSVCNIAKLQEAIL